MYDLEHWTDYTYDYHQEYVKKEMEETRDFVLSRLKSKLPHLLNDIALMIASSYLEDDKSAIKIIKELDLSNLELMALIDNYASFEEEFLKYQYIAAHE